MPERAAPPQRVGLSPWRLPDPSTADSDAGGLVAFGADLRPATLVDAYRRGIFPWYDEGLPVCWWSPDPRAVFDLEHIQPPRRLARTYRSAKFTLTVNRDFARVIRGCADRPDEGTWITPDMMAAYEQLHALGYAHSVEAWQDGALAGGIYGVAICGLFA